MLCWICWLCCCCCCCCCCNDYAAGGVLKPFCRQPDVRPPPNPPHPAARPHSTARPSPRSRRCRSAQPSHRPAPWSSNPDSRHQLMHLHGTARARVPSPSGSTQLAGYFRRSSFSAFYTLHAWRKAGPIRDGAAARRLQRRPPPPGMPAQPLRSSAVHLCGVQP